MNQPSFLAARAKAALANEEWSRKELGKWVAVLDLGCTVLATCAQEVAVHVDARAGGGSHGEEAVSLLSLWMVSRAGSICSLLLQGYPTDAGALLRSLLEVEAMQELLASDPDSADRWMRNEEINVGEYLRIVRKRDTSFGRAWSDLGTVVHPNRKAVINQMDESTGRAILGAGGARRPEQLLKVGADFGVQAKREVQMLESIFDLRWSDGLSALVRDFEGRLDQMHTEVFRRWPGSKTVD